MNTVAIVILVALTADYLLQLASGLLNSRTLSKPLPGEFSDIYDEASYRRSQTYSSVRIRFGLIVLSVQLSVLLGFWFAGGFDWLDGLVRSAGHGPVVTGLLFIGLLMLGNLLLNLPFRAWSTFVIEERFGFNRTTASTFVADLLKGMALSLLLGAPLLAGVIALFHYSGPAAWLWAWAGITLFSLTIQFIAPAWILPLFNRFDPLEDGPLREKIENYSKQVDFPLREIYVMDGSKRSGKSNAFFTGFGKNKRIALFDTLIEQMTPDQLLAVVAHEVGHYKLRHIPKNMVIGTLHTGLLLLLLSYVLQMPALFDAFGMSHPSVYAGLVFFGLLYSPAERVLSVAMNGLSRRHEFEADAWSVRTTGMPDAMAGALKSLSRENLSHLTPHPLTVFLDYSHPPVTDRLRAIRRIGTDTPDGLPEDAATPD